MLYRIFLTIVLFATVVPAGGAQTGYFRTAVIKEGEGFSFPIFSRTGSDRVSTRINRLLQLSELYFLAKSPYSTRIFDQAKLTTEAFTAEK